MAKYSIAQLRYCVMIFHDSDTRIILNVLQSNVGQQLTTIWVEVVALEWFPIRDIADLRKLDLCRFMWPPLDQEWRKLSHGLLGDTRAFTVFTNRPIWPLIMDRRLVQRNSVDTLVLVLGHRIVQMFNNCRHFFVFRTNATAWADVLWERALAGRARRPLCSSHVRAFHHFLVPRFYDEEVTICASCTSW